MFIIAGLGNPDAKYAKTRHNMGFDTIDLLADTYGIEIRDNKFKAMTGTGVIEGTKVLLVKPLTYMNNSGESLRAACDFYKLDPEEDLLVIYDDITLAPGRLRIRKKGSAGGHNGIKSIIQHLGTQNFKRIRVGIGEKPADWDLADYVLSRMSPEDRKEAECAMKDAVSAAAMIVTGDIDGAMNRMN